MRIIATAIFAIFALFSLAGVPQAQVAAPSLNPAGVIGSSTFNPAVLNWGGPSRFGGAIVDVDVDFSNATGTIPIAAGDGTAFQVRMVGDNAAFHADMVSVSLDVDSGVGGGTVEFDDSFIGLSYQWGDSFSLGIALVSEEENCGAAICGGPSAEENSLPLLGGTLRLGESLLVGAATGTETFNDGTADVERSVLMMGVALHSRDKMGGYHLEAYMDNRASGENIAAGVSVEEEETFGLTAEVVFMENFLLGIQSISTDVSNTTGALVEDVSETTLTAGWVDGEGLSFVASSSTNEETDAVSGDVFEFSFLALAVAYAF